MKILKDEVGTAVLTKAVGYNSKHDITNLYKKKEGKIIRGCPHYRKLFLKLSR